MEMHIVHKWGREMKESSRLCIFYFPCKTTFQFSHLIQYHEWITLALCYGRLSKKAEELRIENHKSHDPPAIPMGNIRRVGRLPAVAMEFVKNIKVTGAEISTSLLNFWGFHNAV
ncbi:hypothetical protein SAY86_001397 [Trapa natans]|uniref:Uncharacterized protein n=1 Tax=Trapa natans TaxID=22666 RepID=A0AAN7REM2_TRANT|nr:hypothetical protein SAY86_001397 [Trapa natans]